MNVRNRDKKLVFILAQEAGGIPTGLKNGFVRLGFEAHLNVYNSPLIKNRSSLAKRFWNRIKDPGQQRSLLTLFNRSLEEGVGKIAGEECGALIIMRGNYLSERNRSLLESRKGLPLISWLYDPMGSCPMQKEVALLADHVLCADGKDLALYPGKSSWCPLGYDDDVYGMKSVEKDIDLLISGSIGYCYRRRRTALEIIGMLPAAKKMKCVFIGSTGSSFGDMKVRTGAFSWVAKRLQPQELALYQSRAKICVNVHRDDCDKMVNPSFFSIPGSGSCQLVERREHFNNFLSPGEDFIDFSGKDELLEKVFTLLENEELRNNVTRNGYGKVKEKHTMKERASMVEKILSEIRRREGN